MSAELESKIAAWETILSDEAGRPRTIQRIEFEAVGTKVRFSLFGDGRRLQTISVAMRDLGELLEATKLFMGIATGDPTGLDLSEPSPT